MKTNNVTLSRGFAKRDPIILLRIIRVLNKHKGNLKEAGHTLKIDQWTLRRWIDKEPKLAQAWKDAKVAAIAGYPGAEVVRLRADNERLRTGIQHIINDMRESSGPMVHRALQELLKPS